MERAPKHATASESKLGKLYTFIGARGGVGTTTMAVNFASVLAQRKQSTVSGFDVHRWNINGNAIPPCVEVFPAVRSVPN